MAEAENETESIHIKVPKQFKRRIKLFCLENEMNLTEFTILSLNEALEKREGMKGGKE